MRWTKRAILALVVVQVLWLALVGLGTPERRRLVSVRLDDTTHEPVDFPNAEQALELAGLLFVPEGPGPFPAAVVIHGSGPSRRDNGWYLTVVEHLRRQGVLVLLPDKRGSESSEGAWRTATYEDLATDTVAAVRYLDDQARFDLDGIGVIGFSQGGRIAPIVAASLADLAFVVDIVGGAVPAHEALVYEETHNLLEVGVLPGLAHLLAYPAGWSLIHLRQKDHWDAVGDFDPLRYWRRVSVPSLVLFGSEDTNVDTERSASRLRSLENDAIQVRIYEGSGHALEDPPERGDHLFRRDALEAILGFIRAHT